jgi:hypothetical protein
VDHKFKSNTTPHLPPATTRLPPWLWTSTFQQQMMKKMTLLEVLMARTTHLLLEPTPREMLVEHLLCISTWQDMNKVRQFGAPLHTELWY